MAIKKPYAVKNFNPLLKYCHTYKLCIRHESANLPQNDLHSGQVHKRHGWSVTRCTTLHTRTVKVTRSYEICAKSQIYAANVMG